MDTTEDTSFRREEEDFEYSSSFYKETAIKILVIAMIVIFLYSSNLKNENFDQNKIINSPTKDIFDTEYERLGEPLPAGTKKVTLFMI